jgi:hypothetical protein
MDTLTIIILFVFFGIPCAIAARALWECWLVTKEIQKDYNENE